MMDELQRKYHEVADIFPLMTGEEFDALKADISVNGQREPIWLHPDGSIIDGRNRHRACIDLDIAPHFRTWDGNGSLVAFVVSLNLHRRHLTSGQKRSLLRKFCRCWRRKRRNGSYRHSSRTPIHRYSNFE